MLGTGRNFKINTGIERTMLKVIDTTDQIGSLLRRETVNRMLLGKRPQGIAGLDTNRLVRDVGDGIGICRMTGAKN